MKTLIIFLALATTAFAGTPRFNSPGRPMHQTRTHVQHHAPRGSYIFINPRINSRRQAVRVDTQRYRRQYEAHYRSAHEASVRNVDVSARYGGGPLMIINPYVKQ